MEVREDVPQTGVVDLDRLEGRVERGRRAADLLDQEGPGLARKVEQLGGVVVGLVFVVELEFLPGRKKLEGYDVRSLIKYQS